MAPWAPGRCWFRASWEGRGASSDAAGTKNWFGDARSSVGAFPTTRLLQGWWVRRGRTSHLRSFLFRWHVDEDDEDLACADAGSGSHNLDAPYLARQRCRGKSASTNTYGDRAPSG